MPRRKLNEEVIELYSELTHSLLPLIVSWKDGAKDAPTKKFILDHRSRVGQVLFYQPQAVMLEVVSSDWYDAEGDWIGHRVRAYVLEDAGQWKGKAGEAWIIECVTNGTMWSVDTGT
jgi:hypothetical protein